MNESLEGLRAQALEGDRAALSQLCLRLGNQVFKLAVRFLGDIADAEDATQDVLVKIVTHLAQFEGRSALSTWAHTIAVRHLLAARASRAEQRGLTERLLTTMLEQGLAFADGAPAPTPEDQTFTDEVRLSCTQGMLMFLSRDERLALVLVELLGFDAAESAAICGLSHDAFRQRLSRARRRLGTFVAERCGEANPNAPCRCSRQLPAKLARARSRGLSLLSEGDVQRASEVQAAAAELRHARAIAAAFHPGGSLAMPHGLRERLRDLLPSLLARP